MARMNRPAPVEITYKNMRFLITHNPTNATLNKFIEVRVLEWEAYVNFCNVEKFDYNSITEICRRIIMYY